MTSQLSAVAAPAAAPATSSPLRSMSAVLKAEEYTVIVLHFDFRLTQGEIARALNVSQQTVSRLLEKAVGRLRKVDNLVLDFPE